MYTVNELKPKSLDELGIDTADDIPLSDEDREVGHALAYAIGDTFLGPMTPLHQWSVIAKALRVHGLQITNRE